MPETIDAASAAAAYQGAGIRDSLTTLQNGLANPRDRIARASWITPTIDRMQLAAAYRGDWIARKGIDIPAKDMTRAGRDWQADGADIEKIEAEEKRAQLWGKVQKALKLARLYGGSAIILGVAQGNPWQPLRPNGLGVGSLRYLHVVDRHRLSLGPLNLDPLDPGFMQPTYYQLHGQRQQITLHPSRVVPFYGVQAPEAGGHDEFWGDSALLALDDAIKAAGLAQTAAFQLVGEAKVDVYKIKNLSQIAKSQVATDAFQARWRLAQDAKDNYSALITDADEEWDQKQINFSQLPDMVRLGLSIAAGAFDIPATRFLSQSPDGMNATGDSDMRNYYDRINSDQEFDLRPQLERIDEVVVRSALGTVPADLYFQFAPLWQLTEKERAEILDTKARAARTIVGTGGMSPQIIVVEAVSDALVNSLVEDGSLPGLEAAVEKHGTVAENEPTEAELAAAAGIAQPPANDQPQERAAPERQRAANDWLLDAVARGAVRPVLRRPPGDPVARTRELLTDAKPRPLYVSRPLVNSSEFLAWAKAQGFTQPEAADELHVTLLYSRRPVDWMKMGESWNSDAEGRLTVPAGGPRLVEPLGDKGAVVLLFNSTELQWRHRNMVEAGASHDYDEYQPHVTITYQGAGVDLRAVEPFRGALIFGPERFEELDGDWNPALVAAE